MPILNVIATAEVCFTQARMFLNDANIQLWTDTVLMPMMYQAHTELQTKLQSRASPVMKAYAGTTVPAYTYQLIDVPNLQDMVSPIRIWEKPAGSPESNYQLMTEAERLPLVPAFPGNLQYWMWYQELITFVGAQLDTDIEVYYWRRVPIPTDGTDTVGIIAAEQYLGPRIAALAAASVGEEKTASIAGALAEAQFQIVVSANRSRSPQNIGVSTHP